jgi:hypothetical protein
MAERGITMVGEYKGATIKTRFLCQFEHEWMATPNHVFGGRGCPECADEKRADAFRLTPEKLKAYLADAAKRGITMLGEYKNANNRVLFHCQCGHRWMTRPANIFLAGNGCSECADYGFQMDKPALVYYIKIPNPFGEPLYKIGITNRTIQERFQRDFHKLTILEIWNFKTGAEAWKMERQILEDYAAYRYNGPEVLTLAANNEIFSDDILALDNGHSAQKTFPF